MSPRLYTFQFGRVLLITGSGLEEKRELYSEVFSKPHPVSDFYNKYVFFDVQEIPIDQDSFIVGKLIKYKTKLENVVIEDSALGTSQVEDAIVAQPEFVLHPYTGIVAFRVMPGKFNASQFKNKFARLIEAAFDNFFISAKVETVNEELKIEEQFNLFTSLHSICLELHPSNPHNNDLWREIDDKIKALGAVEYNQQVVAPEGRSLNKEEVANSEIYAGIIMASDGYGHASIEGIQENGRRVKVTTDDNPIETKTHLDGEPEHLVKQLTQTFKMVWDRVKNEHKDKN